MIIQNEEAIKSGWKKYSSNPVLGGEYGTCFDISVLEDSGTYRMYFSWRPKGSIALVESKDGIHWNEPKIVLGPRETKEGWEDELNRPVVVKRSDTYHMWYTGQFKAGKPDGGSWIFYAVSKDGVNWERVKLEPVLSPEEGWEKVAVMNPHVIWNEQESLYKMWYSGGEQYEPNAIGYATSEDGTHWKKYNQNPIFSADLDSQWEHHKAAGCQVLLWHDWYIMFYIGYRDEHYAQIGIARSQDGISRWERHPLNPVIFPTEGEWDGEACYKPYAFFDGNRWLLWYNGRNGSLEQIGLAIHEGEDLGFVDGGQ